MNLQDLMIVLDLIIGLNLGDVINLSTVGISNYYTIIIDLAQKRRSKMEPDRVIDIIIIIVVFISGMVVGGTLEQEFVKNNFKDLNYMKYSSEKDCMVFKDSVTFTKYDYRYIMNGTLKGFK